MITLARLMVTAVLCVTASSLSGQIAKAPAVRLWLESSLKRVFPASPAGTSGEISLLAARNGKVSFQACIRNESTERIKVECRVEGAPDLNVQVRRVGYVPMLHHTTGVDASEQDGVGYIPGLVPDPLFPEQAATIGPLENQSFWVTVTVPAGVQPGRKELKVRLSTLDEKTKARQPLGELTALLDVRSFTLQPRRDFPVTHWWHADAVYDWYKIEPFGEKWWQIVEPYLRDMVSHGSNVIFVPLLHNRREVVPRPPQLLKVTVSSPGRYSFDFTDARRFVRLAKQSGAEYFEFPHLWLYWGAKNPVNVYTREGNRWSLLWPTETDGYGDLYLGFLKQFLPALHDFLAAENILDRSFFHVSDEPGGPGHFERYKAARAILKEHAPWMKVMDALSEVRYGQTGVTDIPVPIIQTAPDFIKAGIPHWVYFCTWPRGKHLNRLFDTPLAKIRMSGWLFYRLKAKGFLHWGYDYWYKMETQELVDPFVDAAGGDWPGIPYGDPFVVYPGPDGPIDSIRWEVFAESLQDYALLQTAGISPDSPVLAEIRDYADFPKSEAWIQRALRLVLDGRAR